jgi:hypothetical protein
MVREPYTLLSRTDAKPVPDARRLLLILSSVAALQSITLVQSDAVFLDDERFAAR